MKQKSIMCNDSCGGGSKKRITLQRFSNLPFLFFKPNNFSLHVKKSGIDEFRGNMNSVEAIFPMSSIFGVLAIQRYLLLLII